MALSEPYGYRSEVGRIQTDYFCVEARLLGGVARDERRPARELVGVAAVEPLEVGALLFDVRERGVDLLELGLGAGVEDGLEVGDVPRVNLRRAAHIDVLVWKSTSECRRRRNRGRPL